MRDRFQRCPHCGRMIIKTIEQRRLIEIMRKAKRPVKTSEVAKKLGTSVQNASNQVNVLVQANLVERSELKAGHGFVYSWKG